MKSSNSKSRVKSKPNGTVQVAVWKDSPEWLRHQDIFTNYSNEVFYDFVRPLKLLDSPGWNSSIRTSKSEDGGFFIFTSEEKPY